ncbi:MAG: hypothetical protein RL671_2375 [Pseudomonadota bacterium]|jgi:hypothetical protein|uniref:hypothetical protein n=1 Tax=Novosphingobium sp. APW14 TaxID=3077237 RepID=UPI0028DD9906|nr:hypothetical protein [Novosphingobium sp. APW14]MDT9011836.1 hypothetical protein [Novosphingobium sp. APW14]
MSRAMNLSLTEAEVQSICDAAKIRISAIEPLPIAGTHVVCRTSEGAEELRKKLSKHLIEGKVKRFAFYRVSSSW